MPESWCILSSAITADCIFFFHATYRIVFCGTDSYSSKKRTSVDFLKNIGLIVLIALKKKNTLYVVFFSCAENTVDECLKQRSRATCECMEVRGSRGMGATRVGGGDRRHVRRQGFRAGGLVAAWCRPGGGLQPPVCASRQDIYYPSVCGGRGAAWRSATAKGPRLSASKTMTKSRQQDTRADNSPGF